MRIAAVSAFTLTVVLGACSQADQPAREADASAPVSADAAPPADSAAPNGDRRGPRGPQTLEQFQARIERGFAGLDADGDGVVTAEELNGASGGRAAPMLARLDADGDGKVTRAEMAAGAQRIFERMDTNGDGVISPDERPSFGRGGPGGPQD
ncbi:MAG: signal transduction protein [Brevundimonas sp.]|uniref:EF-hand domain-containing protein n=1 Tax=Brevundimonas sp. TaxID=1871086 RepID=UPI0011FAF300|nr:EF-hand domain-containing protein [Brevundimonas sp.]RZJ18831.1 MAG: signal transduction protein [Brevundimonas sp.]